MFPNTMEETSIPEKVLRYEIFLNDVLKVDLRKVLEQRDKIFQDLSEYMQLKNVIERIKDSKLKEDLKTKVDLGCNVYVQAVVPDTSMICVHVGFGFYVEFTLPEALRFIDRKVDHLTSKSEQLTKDAAKIKGNIKLVIEGLREIQGYDDTPEEKHRTDIFT